MSKILAAIVGCIIGTLLFLVLYLPIWIIHQVSGFFLNGIDAAEDRLDEWITHHTKGKP